MKEEITLLTKEQVRKSNVLGKLLKNETPSLEVLQQCGISTKATDFVILQGEIIKEGKGTYWTKTNTKDKTERVYFVGCKENIECDLSFYSIGVRPVIPIYKIMESYQDINFNEINWIEEIEYGEYPQSVADEKLEEELEFLYQSNRLQKTNKKYTSMLKKEKCKYQEYIYKNNKYIRMDNLKLWKNCYLSDGRKAMEDKVHWIKVKPIKWLIDRKENIAISKYILAYMPFSYDYKSDYKESNIKEFLEEYFIKEIEPSKNMDMDKINCLIDIMNTLKKEEKPKQKIIK